MICSFLSSIGKFVLYSSSSVPLSSLFENPIRYILCHFLLSFMLQSINQETFFIFLGCIMGEFPYFSFILWYGILYRAMSLSESQRHKFEFTPVPTDSDLPHMREEMQGGRSTGTLHLLVTMTS